MTRTQIIEKAKAICEAKYQEANESRAFGLKDRESRLVNEWITLAEAFAELFEIPEDYFLGITS